MTEDIKDWLRSQEYWLQKAACIILANNNLSDDTLAEIVRALKSPPESPDALEFPNIGSVDQGTNTLELNAIGPIHGIDALNPRSPLSFGSHQLSVVYGRNGSGKSGYTRILKKASGKAGAANLKSDVYAPTPDRQECTFKYKLNDGEKEVTWLANDSAIEDLKALDLFDTAAGEIYLKNETELSYTPPELALLEQLVETCKRVEAELKEEAARLTSKLPKLPDDIKSTTAAIAYTSLQPTTDVNELCNWGDAHEVRLTALKKRLETKDPVVDAKRLRTCKKQCDSLIESVQSATRLLSEEAYQQFIEKLTESNKARTAANESVKALSEHSHLDGIGTATWKALWQAAKDFSSQKAYPEWEYPNTSDDSRCVLCQQELDAAAKSRMTEFESYVSGTLETAAATAEKAAQEQLDALPAIIASKEIETIAQAASLNETTDALLPVFWQKAQEVKSQFEKKDVDAPAIELSYTSALLQKELTAQSELYEKDSKQLDKDAKSFNRSETEKELKELEAKKWIAAESDAIQEEVKRLKRLETYQDWIRETGTRGISAKSGQLLEALITEAYIERFNDELEKLGARHIKVELVKSRTTYGRNKHIVRLKDLVAQAVSPTDVFSEGEHRIVALAAFLADVCGRPSKTPFIFDDPITSLDQKYEEHVIDRLIELSQERQVLIFTHRLSFLGIISDKAGAALKSINIRRESWGTGHVGEIPIYGKNPKAALNTLKEERVKVAEKIRNEHGSDSYYPLAKSICSDFRIVIERIIENVFLADVVQRHRRQIKTLGREIFKLTRITNEDCKLVHNMMTKYSSYEHSQAPEAPVEMPSPEDLRADLDTILAWHDEYKRRQV